MQLLRKDRKCNPALPKGRRPRSRPVNASVQEILEMLHVPAPSPSASSPSHPLATRKASTAAEPSPRARLRCPPEAVGAIAPSSQGGDLRHRATERHLQGGGGSQRTIPGAAETADHAPQPPNPVSREMGTQPSLQHPLVLRPSQPGRVDFGFRFQNVNLVTAIPLSSAPWRGGTALREEAPAITPGSTVGRKSASVLRI